MGNLYRYLATQRKTALTAALTITLTTNGLVSGQIPITKSALADSQRVVSLFYDGQQRIVTTEADKVSEVLKRAGVTLNEGDLVEPSADTFIPKGFFNINVYRSRPVVVIDGDNIIRARSAYSSPRLVAEQVGLAVYPEDEYSVDTVDDFVGLGSLGERIVIDRAIPFTVLADGANQVLRTQKTTVAEALAEAGVSLGVEDSLTPAGTTALSPGTVVTITRVKEVTITKDETIKRAIRTINDDQLEIGHKVVQEAGRDGKRQVTYRVRYENGREVSRQTLENKLLEEPVAQVIAVGTKITDNVWYRLRLCESGNNYTRNSGNGYYGAYQFDLSTWQSNGGAGYPHHASPAEQDRIAQALQARRGWYPWPTCAKKLGLI